MKLPIAWLRDYLTIDLSTNDIAARLATLGFPVDDIVRRTRYRFDLDNDKHYETLAARVVDKLGLSSLIPQFTTITALSELLKINHRPADGR